MFWLLVAVAFAVPVRGHEGPPFPILTDQRVGPYAVSVWTDPDIGTGIFFVVLEPAEGESMPEPQGVRVAVTPVSGRLPEAVYTAEAQEVRYGARYYAEVAFDRGERWAVRILVDGPGGGELRSEVEATPDGTIGPMALLVYLLPFLAVGGLWLKAVLRHRKGGAKEASPG